ncbi:hypothetical protein GCM10023314_19220 [Algibacter agarivorans]|uniref:Ferric reductase like transmembrane component n=1 Tax=Algibacter agarivorans TaxID=1109741 RepID=A0ABP9GJW4_9FLAO
MVVITVIATAYLAYTGYTYYITPLEERFYHLRHTWFKPSGIYGQGLGIIGTLMILFGVSIYIARKRYNFLSKKIRLKYLLEFHIFLCTLGPILILFHTAFKFGGIVSIAFWSMVAVVLSGVVGRFIYMQIPRTIEGRALTLREVKNLKTDLGAVLDEKFNINNQTLQVIENVTNAENTSYKNVRQLKKELGLKKLPINDQKYILKLVRDDMRLSGKIARLETMQRLLKYWHVAHLPFALIMLVIVIIHIAITVAFGYKWIF